MYMKLKEKKVSSQQIYNGVMVNLYKDTVLCPNGNLATRELVRRQCEASCVLAFLDNGKILLEKQYRYPYDDILFELPAGKIDEGETAIEAAYRELEEETGYKAQKMEYLGHMYPTCAYTDEIIHLYIATNLTKTSQHLDENEAVEVLSYSLEEILHMIETNEIKDAKSICAIQFYLLKNNKIKL